MLVEQDRRRLIFVVKASEGDASEFPLTPAEITRARGVRKAGLTHARTADLVRDHVDYLEYVGKRIHPDMIRAVVRRLIAHGISVKGYFILDSPRRPPSSCS